MDLNKCCNLKIIIVMILIWSKIIVINKSLQIITMICINYKIINYRICKIFSKKILMKIVNSLIIVKIYFGGMNLNKRS